MIVRVDSGLIMVSGVAREAALAMWREQPERVADAYFDRLAQEKRSPAVERKNLRLIADTKDWVILNA